MIEKLPTRKNIEAPRVTKCGKLPRAMMLAAGLVMFDPSQVRSGDFSFDGDVFEGGVETSTDFDFDVGPPRIAKMHDRLTDIEKTFPEGWRDSIEGKTITLRLELPTQFKDDLRKVIGFALESGAANTIEPSDLNHCHVLLKTEDGLGEYHPYIYKGALTGLVHDMLSNYSGLLCHSQEYGDIPGAELKRNIAIMKGGTPYIVTPPDTKDHTLYPHDFSKQIGQYLVETISVQFEFSDDGPVELSDGRHLDVYFPFAANLISPNIEVDVPFDKQ